ncbi:SPP1 gp7 family putative phage head morphogenesis protein [Pontibacter aydingkolensis]|uniref:Phage head morphogenesis protein n=1 Tax=Pontibacter aydingkolensis TaxID=1911536 RepID=A0ABS7CQU8_9BACT|nr:phage minor head protein [Pontibacter aydingkolensis]MBW7466189.1 phage head morphogenesis protein [Pontibacter aydingkolensis]
MPSLTDWFKRIFEAKGKPTEMFDVNVFNSTYDHLNKAVKQNYVYKYSSDEKVVEALQKNVRIFSLFKTHKQQRDIAALLVGKNKIKDYDEFEREALKISLNYNRHWLKAEYNTAVEQARLVSYWQKIDAEKETFPYLQYITRDDGNVRHQHQQWDRKILPVDHAWWNTHYPTNGFNCRCTVRQLTEGDAKRLGISKEKNRETYKGEFNFNCGKTQQIFGEYHSYFQDLPDETVKLLKEYAENTSMTEERW